MENSIFHILVILVVRQWWGAYININLLTSLFKGFIGSEEIVYQQ